MDSARSIFTARNLMVLSLAINVSFILRLGYQTFDIKREQLIGGDGARREALSTQRAHLSVSTTSSSSPTTFPGEDRHRVINLDQ